MDVAECLLEFYKTKCIERNCKFINSESTRTYIEKVAHWLCKEDKKFGLLLYGNVGAGKTTILKAIAHMINYILSNEAHDAKFRDIRSIVSGDIVDMYYNAPSLYTEMKEYKMLTIDELGCENLKQKDFGTNLMIDILQYRYRRQLFTIVTSNLSDEDFKERYFDRIDDRGREMFDRLHFDNESFRK